MNSYDKLTRQQAEEQMNLYRKVFTVVRLLDAVDLRLTGNNKTKEYQMGELNNCRCYDYWKKSQPCENCISRKVYQGGQQIYSADYERRWHWHGGV